MSAHGNVKKNLNRRIRFRLCLPAFLLLASGAWAVDTALDGSAIIENAYNLPTGETSHSLVEMKLIDEGGEVHSRVVENWSMESAAGTNSNVIVFHSPATVKDTRFLSIENTNRDDDQWIYLPALGRVRRIAASEGDSSFMGTDFTYNDMQSREVYEDNHTLLREERFEEWDCYVVESIPKDPSSTQYSRRIQWIIKDTWMPVKGELYDKDGELLKVLSVRRLERVQGFWTAIDTTMENVQTGHSTELNIKKLVYNQDIPDSLFTVNFLRTGRP
ncbi:MAG: outer membrane lipoprotein-sorting protein [Sediminispirochaetaceae bacterium]